MSEFIDLQDNLIQTCMTFLLKDKTTKKNIVFATDSYAEMGDSYGVDREITKSLLASLDLKPRILKSQEEQALRTRKKAEMFTLASDRKSKAISDVTAGTGTMPDWFRAGVTAAPKAPTATNQQKFMFGMKNGEPAVKVKGIGPYTKVDCGIVAYHFEVASGRKVQVI